MRTIIGPLANYFPKKTQDLQSFLEYVCRNEGIVSVTIMPCIRNPFMLRPTKTLGYVGVFKYSVRIQADFLRKRSVIYIEQCFSRESSSFGYLHSEERKESLIELYLTAEKLMQCIRVKINETIPLRFMTIPTIADETFFEKLHERVIAL